MQRWRSLQNFSEKIKKDRDHRQKDGRSLARSLPDSHGQPGYFAVFLNSHPAQLSAPGYFRASYSHSQKTFFLRDMKPLGLFVLPLYHRGAAFAMNSARTKPQQYPTETQRRDTTPKLFRRTFRRMEFGRAFALCQRRAGIVLIRMRMIFNNSCASLCGQTFDIPFPLSLFLSAERSGRLKIVRELYRLCFLRSPVYRGIHRKRCRSRAWFSLPL